MPLERPGKKAVKSSDRCAAGGKAQEVRCVIQQSALNPSANVLILIRLTSVKTESSLPVVALGDVTILAMAAGLCRKETSARSTQPVRSERAQVLLHREDSSSRLQRQFRSEDWDHEEIDAAGMGRGRACDRVYNYESQVCQSA